MKTNIDAIIGKHGIVHQRIAKNKAGMVEVEDEQWRARSKEAIDEGEEVEIMGVKGVTLQVRKAKGEKGVVGRLGKFLGKEQK